MFITISDVHHGAKDYEEMRNEFYCDNGFISNVTEAAEEDEFIGVGILGDWFDKKLDANDPKYILAVTIVIHLASILCTRKKFLVILRGTASHDLQQLNAFEYLQLVYPKYFRLFDSVGEMKFGNLKTLIIPEEYPVSYEDYYGKFLKKKYDLILGHGYFKWNSFSVNEAERSLPRMPIHDEETFSKMATLVIFGHDHTFKNYKNIFYGGSFSRLCHGEENPKGYLLSQISNGDYEVIHIENEEAPIYKKKQISSFLPKKGEEIKYEEIIRNIESFKNKNSVSELRIDLPSPFIEDNPEIVDMMRNYFSSKDGYKINKLKGIKNDKTKDTDESDDKDSSDTTLDFLLSESSIVDKIYEYNLLKNPESTLTKENITKALSKEGK